MNEARVLGVSPSRDGFLVTFADGRDLYVPYAWFPRLLNATDEERTNYYLTENGKGICWPDVDEDVSVQGLLEGRRSAESPASFAAWQAGRSSPPERVAAG
jgi:hypothetical protein